MLGHSEVECLPKVHRLTRFCVPEEQKTWAGECKVQTTDFPLGDALESHYPLLELVFRYLDEKSLKNAILVCTAWKETANKVLSRRIYPTWMTYHNCPKPTLFHSQGYNFNRVAITLIVYDQSRMNLDKKLCIHSKADERKLTFIEYLHNIASEQYCAIACSAVSSILGLCDSVFQAVFIPHIPHVRTVMFEFNHIETDLSSFMNEDEQLKACLIFTKKYNARNIETFLNAVLEGRNHKCIAMGGGIINCKRSLKMPENCKLRDQNLLCIAFLQRSEYNFRAYSAVILNERENGNGFAEELQRFKETTTPLYQHGIVFRFCCKAKRWKTEETELIYKFYPDYIVFGMDVEGEIGWNTFDLPSTEEYSTKKKRKRTFPETLNGWTSVLVLVTWGNKIKNCQR